MQFRKQTTPEQVEERLKAASLADIKKPGFAKGLVEGKSCTMICHLIKAENNLGRSLVIDLTAEGDNKIRQIDHRTIESITFKNVKYVLKKSGKKQDLEEEKKAERYWDPAKLAIGNWFSQTSYNKVESIGKDDVNVLCNGENQRITKNILIEDMFNASVYAKEEKLALTKVVKIMREARSVAFTVNFNCKVDEKVVAEKLGQADAKTLGNAKAFAKELLTGKEQTVVGRLSKTENHLGRSLIVGLEQPNSFAQVDHRHINWLIFKNVKYVVQH